MRKVGVFFNMVNQRTAEIWHNPFDKKWPYIVREYIRGEFVGTVSFNNRRAADDMATDWINWS